MSETITLRDQIMLPAFEKLLEDKHIGYMLIGLNREVVFVNAHYCHFHTSLNGQFLQVGKTLLPISFENYPPDFFQVINSHLSLKADKVDFFVSDPNDINSQWELKLSTVKSENGNVEGVSIMAEKVQVQSFASVHGNEQELFKVFVQHTSDIYQLADAGLTVKYTSGAIYNALGYAPHEMHGRSVLELVHPDDKDNLRDALIELRSGHENVFTIEYRIKNKQGEWTWIENNAKNLLSADGVKAIVMNLRNIQSKKVADQALVQAEQRLSLLLNNTEESFIILNSRLRIITYNRAAQEQSPYFFKSELQSGMSVLDLIESNEVPEVISIFERVFNGEEIERETFFVDPNNKQHIFSHSFRPLFGKDNDIFGVFITSTNITERKQLSEKLAINSERLKTANQIARLGYFEYDFQTRQSYCSDLLYNILGVTKETHNLSSLSFIEEIAHPEDKEAVRAEIEKSIQTGTEINFEFRLHACNKQGKVILAIGGAQRNSTGILQNFRVTFQDITDSKMAILAIQTLELRFKSLFDHSIDGVVLSKVNGDIMSANPAICTMLGYSEEEILALNRDDLMDAASPLVVEMMEKRQRTGFYYGEIMLRHKQGHFIPVEITSISMKDGDDYEYLSTIIRDITEKKKIEQEQKSLTEELLKNNQDLQQFSFITSHNLRAPVANLLSLLSLYNKENPADDFNIVLLEKFEEATHQLNQTLNDLVNVLVIKSNTNIEKELINLNAIYKDARKNIDSLLSAQEGVIEADFSAVDTVLYNRIHIESIFLNMITNAIRYRSDERAPAIKIRSYQEDKWVVIEFKDNGLGMDLKRYGDRLFGLYQRFHDSREGKGLGLYMTQNQVRAMGGKIEVESEPGIGTTFKVYFKS